MHPASKVHWLQHWPMAIKHYLTAAQLRQHCCCCCRHTMTS